MSLSFPSFPFNYSSLLPSTRLMAAAASPFPPLPLFNLAMDNVLSTSFLPNHPFASPRARRALVFSPSIPRLSLHGKTCHFFPAEVIGVAFTMGPLVPLDGLAEIVFLNVSPAGEARVPSRPYSQHITAEFCFLVTFFFFLKDNGHGIPFFFSLSDFLSSSECDGVCSFYY